MAIVKVLAEQFDLSYNTGTDAVPVWTAIGGVTAFSISTTKNDIDTRDFDSGGWMEHIVGSRGKTFSIEGSREEDPITGARDPGQAAVETLGDQMGAAGIGTFQIVSPGGTTYTFGSSVNVTPFGGGLDAKAAWKVDMTMTGQWAVV